jgi:hypothetical protein
MVLRTSQRLRRITAHPSGGCNEMIMMTFLLRSAIFGSHYSLETELHNVNNERVLAGSKK